MPRPLRMRTRRAGRTLAAAALLILTSEGACTSDDLDEASPTSTRRPTSTTETATSDSSGDTSAPLSPEEELLIGALASVGVQAERAELAFNGASLVGLLGGQELHVVASGVGTSATATTLSQRTIQGVAVSEVTYGSGVFVDQFECQELDVRVSGPARDADTYDDGFLGEFIAALGCT